MKVEGLGWELLRQLSGTSDATISLSKSVVSRPIRFHRAICCLLLFEGTMALSSVLQESWRGPLVWVSQDFDVLTVSYQLLFE
jgi:hypothetical protein